MAGEREEGSPWGGNPHSLYGGEISEVVFAVTVAAAEERSLCFPCCEYTHRQGKTGRDSSLPPLSGWGWGWGWRKGLTSRKITLSSSTAAGWGWG